MPHTLLDVLDGIDPNDGVRALTVKKFVETSEANSFMQFEERPNLTSTFFTESELPETDFRAYNSEAVDSGGQIDEERKTTLKPLAGRIEVDPLLAEVSQRNGENYVAKQISLRARSMGFRMKETFIGRSNTPLQPRGLYGWVDEYNNANNPTLIDAATSGSTIAGLGASGVIQLLGELTDIVLGRPTMFLTNRTIIRQIQALTVTAAANNALAEYLTFDWMTVPGTNVQKRMAMWQGIPMVPVDYNAQRQEIMAFDEPAPDGSGADNCSSILAVIFGEEDTMMLQKDRSGPIIRDNTYNKRIIDIDWPMELEVRRDRSVGRIRGIRLS